jgi:hypothetical protein
MKYIWEYYDINKGLELTIDRKNYRVVCFARDNNQHYGLLEVKSDWVQTAFVVPKSAMSQGTRENIHELVDYLNYLNAVPIQKNISGVKIA